MAETPFSSRLRFLDADDLDDSTIDFSTLDVHGADDSTLGDLDGFLVDAEAGRVVYAVVDSGGWFRSRHFAVPIGHARLDAGRRRLNVNVTRTAATKFPDFDPDDLRTFSDDEMRAFEQRTAIVCCPDDPADVSGAVQHDRLRHYAQPDWWRLEYQRPERYQNLERWERRDAEKHRARASTRPVAPAAVRDDYNRDAVRARDSGPQGRDVRPVTEGGEESPHLGGRAQPGDVLGVETAGERTYLGDTSEKENDRRREAETAAGKQRESD